MSESYLRRRFFDEESDKASGELSALMRGRKESEES